MDVKIALNCIWAEVARYNEDSRVREAWQSLNTFVLAAQPTNSSSHDMPSYVDVVQAVRDIREGVFDEVTFSDGVKFAYKCIARHFGH